MPGISRYLPFSPGTTGRQATTYLLGVCLFSIAFLVFLNSSVSFVITDRIGRKAGVGDLVGTLGFADELVALVACPVWGAVSDRWGCRVVCVLGYAIVGIALCVFVQATNVYPQLLLGRILFSVGGAATATMVTALLPSMTGHGRDGDESRSPSASDSRGTGEIRHSVSESIDSEITITPANVGSRLRSQQPGRGSPRSPATSNSSPPRLAGFVGLFTGLGALVSLVFFLPLPSYFSKQNGVSQAQAVADSFYVVGIISMCISVFCFFGLRGLPGDRAEDWRLLLGLKKSASESTRSTDEGSSLPYGKLLVDSTLLGFTDAQIGLGYLGGFLARSSSVAISLFIPLYINAFFIRNGFCQGSPHDSSPELKKECRAAYILSAELTGASQLIALLCAPVFGYLSDRYRRFNLPLLVSSVLGIAGYTGFAQLPSPEPKDIGNRGGSPAVFVMVALIGISQIGSIVCSLGLLGRGILEDESRGDYLSDATASLDAASESAPLLDATARPPPGPSSTSRQHLKGSIAGIYSLSGASAILLLTKLGGVLFDTVSPGAPFYMMAGFNGVLLVGVMAAGIYREIRTRAHE